MIQLAIINQYRKFSRANRGKLRDLIVAKTGMAQATFYGKISGRFEFTKAEIVVISDVIKKFKDAGQDTMSHDIDKGRYNIEQVKCPLRGECRNEGIICMPTLQTKLTAREEEIVRLRIQGMSNLENR